MDERPYPGCTLNGWIPKTATSSGYSPSFLDNSSPSSRSPSCSERCFSPFLETTVSGLKHLIVPGASSIHAQSTSTARCLAKAVNCLTGGRGEPCNACEMCRAIAEGHALDIIEIDAASNTGVDDIRSLREKVNYAPNQARYKVYIIDVSTC